MVSRKKIVLSVLSMAFLFGFSCGALAATKTQISVWAMGDEGKKLDIMKELFEKENPTIEVKIQAIPWGDAQTKMLTAITGGTTPDISAVGTSQMAGFQKVGVFEELDSYFTKSTVIKKADFITSTLESNTFGGKLFGMPWYTESRLMFFRKDIYEKAGYKEFPKTSEEFVKALNKIKANGIKYPFTIPVQETNTPTELYAMIWQHGATILGANDKVLVDSPEFIAAIKYYTNFFKNGLAPQSLGGSPLEQLFVNGQLSTFIGGPWMLNVINNGAPKDFTNKYGVAIMPKTKTNTSYIGGCNFVIFKKSKNKEAAFKFLEFLAKADSQVTWYKTINDLPTVIKAWDDASIKSDKNISVFKGQIKDAKPGYNNPNIQKIDRLLMAKVESIIYGKEQVEPAMKELKVQIEKVLKK